MCENIDSLEQFTQCHYLGETSLELTDTDSYRKRAVVDGEALLYDIYDLCCRDPAYPSIWIYTPQYPVKG